MRKIESGDTQKQEELLQNTKSDFVGNDRNRKNVVLLKILSKKASGQGKRDILTKVVFRA